MASEFLIRKLPEETKNKIKRIAKKESRSLNGQILHILNTYKEDENDKSND